MFTYSLYNCFSSSNTGGVGMKCCIKGCNETAIGAVGEVMPIGAGRRKRISRCPYHQTTYLAWVERRKNQIKADEQLVEYANEGAIPVRAPQIQHTTGNRCIDNINLRLKEIYCEQANK